MIERGQHLHLLRGGELIDAVLTDSSQPQPPSSPDQGHCVVELSYRGRKLQACGVDRFDALIALRGALEVEGLFMPPPSRAHTQA